MRVILLSGVFKGPPEVEGGCDGTSLILLLGLSMSDTGRHPPPQFL